MAIDVTEETFQQQVLDRSAELPVVTDFWAEWCGPCRTLTPALRKAAEARAGKVELVEVDVDANQGLAMRYGVQGIPAVKAFRDGEVIDEFVGAQPPRAVEAFFDRLVPSEADQLVQAGGEEDLRRALELEPARADAALALARILHERGEDDEAADLLGKVAGNFEAEGLAARIRLGREPDGPLTEALEAFDSGDREKGIELLLPAIDGSEDGQREDIRKAIVGALNELGTDDPRARDYRRRLAAALY